ISKHLKFKDKNGDDNLVFSPDYKLGFTEITPVVRHCDDAMQLHSAPNPGGKPTREPTQLTPNPRVQWTVTPDCWPQAGTVVDVYQEWCGPCAALVGNFRRLKNELGDNLLNFAIAKADTIDALEKYRGRCEPTFLFYAGGILTSFIHGANAPKVQRVITEQLAHEHKVLEGTAERKEVKDTVITRQQEIEDERALEEAAQREAEGPLESSSSGTSGVKLEAKGVTVAIIKPDAVAQGKADEIKAEMTEKGIEIIAEEERTLTEDEAREMYSELQEEEYFDELIKFITSGPSHLLVLTRGTTGETIVKDWRDMIGPTNVEEAKSEAPDSLRAKYGEKGYMNALHGSSSSDAAAKELAFFFPNLAIPTYQKKKENIQRTLALVRPQAFADKKDEILAKINEAGFKIAMYKEIELTREQAADFYKEHEQFPYYEQLVETMSSGPLLALGLARDEAISAWRDMLGPANIDDAQETAPDSLRAQYPGDAGINMFHGSDSEEAAKKELNYFFPVEQTVAVIKPDAMGTKDAIIDKIHEAGFKIAARKETVITQDIAEILYPHCKDKEYYDDLVTSMTSGPTMFMVLSREDAVEGWRRELGETDPEQAKANNPVSIRAQFGQDILNNAAHGSSNLERAIEEMRAVFGELSFNTDGTVQGEQPELDEAVVVIEKDPAAAAADVAPEYRRDGQKILLLSFSLNHVLFVEWHVFGSTSDVLHY
ncbi:thioredoxin domain-containing protein 3-like protein, partial [Elysia marginata]